MQPAAGTTYVMRGVVELQWRELVQVGAEGAQSAQGAQRPGTAGRAGPSASRWCGERTLLTKTGMKDVQGGDPAGLSKAMCLIW